MNRKAFPVLLVLFLVFSSMVPLSVFVVHASPDTLTLRPNAVGTYNQFVEVPNSGFISGDQFEDNTFNFWNTWVNTGCTIVTSPVIDGIYTAKVSPPDTDECTFAVTLASSCADIYFRERFQIPVLPAIGQRVGLINIISTGWDTPTMAAIYNNGGTMQWELWEHNYNIPVSTTPTITINTVYDIMVRRKTGSGNGISALYVNGNKICEVTTETQTNNSQYIAVGEAVYEGGWSNVANYVVYSDSFVMSTSPIAYTNRANLVNDQSDNTALQVTTSITQKETEALANSGKTTETINSVTAYCRAKTSGSTSDKFVFLMRMGASESESAEIALTTSFAEYSVAINDPDGGAWSWTDIDALELGSRASTLASTKTEQFSDYWIVVVFTSGGQEYSRTSSLTLNFAFSTSRLETLGRSVTQSLAFHLSTTRAGDFYRAVVQSLNFSLATQRLAALLASASLSLVIGVATNTLTDFTRMAALTITFTLAAITLTEFYRAVTGTLILSLSTSRLAEFLRAANLTLSFALSTLASVTGLFIVYVSLMLGFGLATNAVVDFSRIAALSLTFSLATLALVEYIRLATLGLSLTLATQRLKEAFRNVAATLSFALSNKTASEFIREVAAQIRFNLSTARLAEFYRTVTQSLNFSLITEGYRQFIRDVALALKFHLVTERLMQFTRLAVLTLSITFIISRYEEFTRLVDVALNFLFEVTGLKNLVLYLRNVSLNLNIAFPTLYIKQVSSVPAPWMWLFFIFGVVGIVFFVVYLLERK